MSILPSSFTSFGLTVQIIWKKITIPKNQISPTCTEHYFYFEVPEIARYLVLPEEDCVYIETLNVNNPYPVYENWLQGTIMAYILQYHDYLVLHGSAVLINNGIVIFSGQSGAGKSTTASALIQRGYSLITDDLVVIKNTPQGQFFMKPGPRKLKLWDDTMHYFSYDLQKASPLSTKYKKYAVSVADTLNISMVPITAFYELNKDEQAHSFSSKRLINATALKTIMQNSYRYFMIKALGKLRPFFDDCSALSQQISVSTITRTLNLHELPKIIHHIELNQGITR